MANVFTSVVKQHWSDMLQENLYKTLLVRELCTMVDIPNGTTKNIPYVNILGSTTYTRYTDVTYSDITTWNDQIILTDTPMVPFQIDQLDKDDNYINITPQVTSDASYTLRNLLDWKLLAEVSNAWMLYDNRWLDAVGWTVAPVPLTTTAWVWYVPDVFWLPKSKLIARWVKSDKLCLVLDSDTIHFLWKFGMEKGFKVADESLTRWYKGDFQWMSVYESNNLSASVVLDLATNPTANDTVRLKGQTFTFVSSIGTTAWNVLIGGSADATAQNLVAAVNKGAWAWTTYVDFDRWDFTWMTATDWTDLVTFTSTNGRMYPASSMTAAANDFRAETVSCLLMEKWAIHASIRDEVSIERRLNPNNLVENFMIYMRWWIKTTTRWAKRMARINIEWSPAEA